MPMYKNVLSCHRKPCHPKNVLSRPQKGDHSERCTFNAFIAWNLSSEPLVPTHLYSSNWVVPHTLGFRSGDSFPLWQPYPLTPETSPPLTKIFISLLSSILILFWLYWVHALRVNTPPGPACHRDLSISMCPISREWLSRQGAAGVPQPTGKNCLKMPVDCHQRKVSVL